MFTETIMVSNNLTKLQLTRYFIECECPITRPTLDKRFKDQKWSYVHARALSEAGLWIEPPNEITPAMVGRLFHPATKRTKQNYRYKNQTGPTSVPRLRTIQTIKVKIPE